MLCYERVHQELECSNELLLRSLINCQQTSPPSNSQAILSSSTLITKSTEYDYLRSWLGDGLLLSDGKKWSGRRKAITPAFHFRILEQFVEIFDRQGNTFIDVLAKYKPGATVDVYPLVTLAALDVICGNIVAFLKSLTPSRHVYVYMLYYWRLQSPLWEPLSTRKSIRTRNMSKLCKGKRH